MKRKLKRETAHPLFVGLEGLAAALDCGRNMADRIGREAGAKVKLGGCARYDLQKVHDYVSQLTTSQRKEA